MAPPTPLVPSHSIQKIVRRNTLPEVEVKVKEECPVDEEEGSFFRPRTTPKRNNNLEIGNI